MKPDIDKVSALIRKVAAEEVLPRFNRLTDEERWEKRPGSWVTVADHASEERLEDGLSAILPGALVIGEEAAEDNPSILDQLETERAAWIVDPVDGTSNFASGNPNFALIVAYVAGGHTHAGWIYEPVTGRMLVAESGAGARLSGEPIHTANPAAAADMAVSLGPRLRRDKTLTRRFAKVDNAACCGTEYLSLASNALHSAHFRNLKPWDHAAGELIHRESGGFSLCVDESPYRAGRSPPGGLLLTPNEDGWREVIVFIREALAALK